MLKPSCIIFIVLILPVSTPRSATDGRATISGFVRSAFNGESLPFANIYLENTNYGTVSDEKGYYVINRIPTGDYNLIISLVGFVRQVKALTVAAREHLIENFQLEPRVIEIAQIVKTAERERFEREVEISNTTLGVRQISDVPMLAEADLFRTLQLLPGVVSRNDFSSQLYVRGGSPDQNLVLLDGVTVYNPFHLGGVFSTFNVDAIKEVMFLTGGFPVEYGGRISSVLNIINREGNSKFYTGGGNVSLLSAKAFLEGPLPRGSFLISARRTYFDQIFKDTEFTFPYYFYDFQGKINFDLSHKQRITISGFYGDDVLDLDVDESENDNIDISLDWIWGNRTTSLNWRWIMLPELYSELLITHSRFRNDLNLDITSGVRGALDLYNRISDNSLNYDLNFYGIPAHELKFGFSQSWLDFLYNIGISDIDLFSYREKPIISSIYMQDQWQITPRIGIKSGLRMDYYSMGRRWRFSPRLAVKYLYFNNLALKVAMGRYYQFISTVHSDDQNFSIMDLWLPLTEKFMPQYADHFVLGMESWLPWNLRFTAELYYKKMNHLLELNEKGEFSDETDDFFRGDGFSSGLEILLKRNLGSINGWIGYTFSSTKRSFDSITYFPKHDRRHTLNTVLNYDLGRGWHFGLVFTLGTGTPYTPVPGKYAHYEWDFADNKLEGEIYNRRGAKNSARYPSYHRMDVSLRKRCDIFGVTSQPYVQIINIYHRKNVFFYFWDHDENPSELTVVEMFPFLPTIGIEFEL